MTYSKGPLRITGPSQGKDHYSGDYAIIEPGDVIIGGAFRHAGKDGDRDAEANARLWAAAPELLEALETLYHLVSEVANPGAFDNGVYAPNGKCEGDVLAGEIIEQARVAIAKTKGGGNE